MTAVYWAPRGYVFGKGWLLADALFWAFLGVGSLAVADTLWALIQIPLAALSYLAYRWRLRTPIAVLSDEELVLSPSVPGDTKRIPLRQVAELSLDQPDRLLMCTRDGKKHRIYASCFAYEDFQKFRTELVASVERHIGPAA